MTALPEAIELLSCPFCGSSGEELGLFCDGEAPVAGPSRRIQCFGCNVEAPFYDSEAEAIAAWNRRAPGLPMPGGGGGACSSPDMAQVDGSKRRHEEPVAWRVKDFADGWWVTPNAPMAQEAADHGALVQPLYLASCAPSAGEG